MQFSAADKATMLDAVGEDATCTAGTLRVVFNAPGSVFGGASAGIVVSEPTALASVADLTALAVVDGTELTIDGLIYQVVSPPLPDGAGFATLTLEAV